MPLSRALTRGRYSRIVGVTRPWIVIVTTMVLGQVLDIEDVAYVVLVAWDVDLVGVLIVTDEDFEESIGSW